MSLNVQLWDTFSGVAKDKKLFKSGRRRLSKVKKGYRQSMSEGTVLREGFLQKKSAGLRSGWATKYYTCSNHYLKAWAVRSRCRTVLLLIDIFLQIGCKYGGLARSV